MIYYYFCTVYKKQKNLFIYLRSLIESLQFITGILGILGTLILTMPCEFSAIFERGFSYNPVNYHNLHKHFPVIDFDNS